jgi:hypothetical protein
MEKVNQIPSSPLDILLLPVSVHKKLSIRFHGLIIAFLFVGIYDMFFYQNMFKEYFRGDLPELSFRLFVFILLSFIVGAIDVICTMVPIAEFAMMIGKRSEKYVNKRMPVILMKSYAISHLFFVIPSFLEVYSGVEWQKVGADSLPHIRLLLSILAAVALFLPFIQFGILYRKISVRTRIQVFGKLILILATYFWMNLSGAATSFFRIVFFGLLERI